MVKLRSPNRRHEKSSNGGMFEIYLGINSALVFAWIFAQKGLDHAWLRWDETIIVHKAMRERCEIRFRQDTGISHIFLILALSRECLWFNTQADDDLNRNWPNPAERYCHYSNWLFSFWNIAINAHCLPWKVTLKCISCMERDGSILGSGSISVCDDSGRGRHLGIEIKIYAQMTKTEQSMQLFPTRKWGFFCAICMTFANRIFHTANAKIILIILHLFGCLILVFAQYMVRTEFV
jgi:hypothetical protein